VSDLQLRTVSTVEAVAQALRERIVDGSITPGHRLPEVRYADELGVARHTFRAATATLVHEGLLRRDRNRGVQVPVLGAADVTDIFRLRAALELEAVRVLMEQPPSERARRIEQLAVAVEDLSALDESAPWRLVVDGDMHFHRGLIDAADSARLLHAYAVVRSEILLCLVRQRPLYDRPQQIAAEHRELLDAIAGDEPDRAATLFRAHLDEAARKLIDRLRLDNEAPADGTKETISE
jgi:DNA-binding GntR family transcriptional regulator